jgi:hypothetical protein
MRTTKEVLLVRIDKVYGLEDKTMFTAEVIAETDNPDINVGDTLIVERDYIQYISENTGYAPMHAWYAIVRDGNIIPFNDNIYLIADPDKNSTFVVNGVKLGYPENFKEYQTSITTHDAVVVSSPVGYVKQGDVVYCHHHLTHPSNERMIDGVMLRQLQMNHIYCVVNEKGIQCMNGWNLIKPVEVEKDSSLKFHNFDTDKSNKYGLVAHPDVCAKHLEHGQEIVFLPERDYEIIVEGETYYRIRTQDIVAKCVVEEIEL